MWWLGTVSNGFLVRKRLRSFQLEPQALDLNSLHLCKPNKTFQFRFIHWILYRRLLPDNSKKSVSALFKLIDALYLFGLFKDA